MFGALLLVLLNGFFVAAEFAIVKVRATRIQQLAEAGNKQARLAQKIISELDAHLSATQLGITLASLGLGWLGEPAVARLLERPLAYFGASDAVIHTVAVVVGFIIITFAHIVMGELAPKSLAILRAETVALWTAYPLHWFYKVFWIFIYALNGLSNLVLRAFGIDPRQAQEEGAHTDEELRMLVSASAQGGYLDETERALLDNVIDFSDRVWPSVLATRRFSSIGSST